METKSDKLRKLADIQEELENISQAIIETKSSYCEGATVSMDIKTTNYNSKLEYLTVELDVLQVASILAFMEQAKKANYNELLKIITGGE